MPDLLGILAGGGAAQDRAPSELPLVRGGQQGGIDHGGACCADGDGSTVSGDPLPSFSQSEEKICALRTTEEIVAVHQEAKAEPEARAVRAAEEILAARTAEKEIAAEEDRTMRRAEEAAAERARIDTMVTILAARRAEADAEKARSENNAAAEAATQEVGAAEKVAAQETVPRAKNSGAEEAACHMDAIMAQAMEEELAALEAEIESAGPQPSQLREQQGDDAGPGNILAKRSRLS